jgi:hypothetical protein
MGRNISVHHAVWFLRIGEPAPNYSPIRSFGECLPIECARCFDLGIINRIELTEEDIITMQIQVKQNKLRITGILACHGKFTQQITFACQIRHSASPRRSPKRIVYLIKKPIIST